MSNWRFKYELTTGVWTDCSPDATGCMVQTKREGHRRKDTFSGTIVFRDAEFDTLYALRSTAFQIGINIYVNATYRTTGYIRLFKGKFDPRNKIASLEVAPNNANYKTLENNWETPIDILKARTAYGNRNRTATYSTTGTKNVHYFSYNTYLGINNWRPVGIDCVGNPPDTFSQYLSYTAGQRCISGEVTYKCLASYIGMPAYIAQGYTAGQRVYIDVVIGITTYRTLFICKATHTTAQAPKTTLDNDAYWYVAGTNNFHIGGSTPTATAWNNYTTYTVDEYVSIAYGGQTYYFKSKGTNANQQPPATIEGDAYWDFYWILVILVNVPDTLWNTNWQVDGTFTGATGLENYVPWDEEVARYYVNDIVSYSAHGGVSLFWKCIKLNTPEIGVNEPPEDGSLANEWWTFLYPKEYYWTRYAYPYYDPLYMQIENGLFFIASCSNGSYNFSIDNGISFIDTLKYMVETTASGITVETNPVSPNYVAPYLWTFAYLRNIIVFDKSDVKYSESSDPAPFEMITLKKYLEILFTMFGELDWYVEEVSGIKYFKLIHPSERPATVWLDLTNHQGKNWTRNISEYQSTAIAINKLGMEFEKSSNADFDYGYHQYNVIEDAVNTVTLSDTCNNVGAVYSLPSNFSDFGLCFVACKSDYSIYDEPTGIVNDVVLMNAPMSASRLVYDHWNYIGGYPSCLVNGVTAQTLITKIGNNTFGKIDFPLIDFSGIDVNGLIKTDLSENLGLDGMNVNTISQKLDNDFAEITLDF